MALPRSDVPGWIDQPPEPLGPPPPDRIADRVLAVAGVVLLLVTVFMLVWLVALAAVIQGTYS